MMKYKFKLQDDEADALECFLNEKIKEVEIVLEENKAGEVDSVRGTYIRQLEAELKFRKNIRKKILRFSKKLQL